MTGARHPFVEAARRFAQERVAPHAAVWERDGTFPSDVFRQGAEIGFSGILLGKNVGGLGLDHVTAAQAFEELSAACFAFAFTLFVNHNVAAAIAANAPPDLVRRYLPEMLRGDRIGAFCLTEADVGSDAAAIATRATKVADGWRLDGEKAWVTNGAVASVFSVYAQTDPSLGWRGIACFLVDGDAPGLERAEPYDLIGGKVMTVGGIRLDGCVVPDQAMILGPGDGFKGAMAGVNRARTVIAAMCCGILRSSLEAAVEYSSVRRAFGRPVAAFQGLRFELADVATDLEAARAMTHRVAGMLDRGETVIVEAAHAKKFATRAALRGIPTCMRAMGANGLRADHSLGRHLASAQICQYLDGTDEIQNIIIGRDLFRGRDVDLA